MNIEYKLTDLEERVELLENNSRGLKNLINQNIAYGFSECKLPFSQEVSDSFEAVLGDLTIYSGEVEMVLVFDAVANVSVDVLVYVGMSAIGSGKLNASPATAGNVIIIKSDKSGEPKSKFWPAWLWGQGE